MPTKTETATCWRVVLPDGKDYESGEGVRHFDTEREAEDHAEERPGSTAKPSATPCVTVSCDECEEGLGSDEFLLLHFESLAEAQNTTREYDWTVKPDGRTYHDGCEPFEDDTTGETETPPKRLTEQQGGIPNDAITPGDPYQRGI